MGHRSDRVCGRGARALLLLLRLQKVDLQEEEGQEGQRQGQKRHRHERRHRRWENRGKNVLLLLFFFSLNSILIFSHAKMYFLS